MRKTMPLVAAALLGASLPALGAAAPGDWPQFRGPDSNGLSTETGLNKDWSAKAPRVLWKVPMQDEGFAGPSVAAGRVYIIDHEGAIDVVKALDFATGAPIWTYRYQDTKDANYGFARATPTFDEGRLYTMSRLGLLHCLDAATGRVIWKHDVVAELGGRRPGWDMAGSPLIDGAKVVVMTGAERGNVAAFNKVTGALIWQGGGSEKPGYSTPVIATINGKRQYVMMAATCVFAVDPNSGARLWSFPFKAGPEVNAPSPIVIGNSVFVTGGYGTGCIMVDVTPDGPKLRWKNTEIQSHFNTPVLFNGYLYGTTDPGSLKCLNPVNGQTVWAHEGFEKGGVLAADGTIIGLCGGSGDLVMARLTPSGYRELGRITPLGGQSWSPPVLAHGKLIIRNTKQLACVDVK